MMHAIIISGFGGQGIIAAGRAIAYAAMQDGQNSSMLPSYGPEMRGGSAHCHVILTDQKIASPLIWLADAVVAMSLPALEKFECRVKPGGTLIVDSHLIQQHEYRTDIHVIKIPSTKLAGDIGSEKLANMVLIGIVMKILGAPSLVGMTEAVKKLLPKGQEALIPLEMKALETGLLYNV